MHALGAEWFVTSVGNLTTASPHSGDMVSLILKTISDEENHGSLLDDKLALL